MTSRRPFMRLAIVFILSLISVLPASAAKNPPPPTGPFLTSFTRWRSAEGGFNSWQRNGVNLAANGTLQLNLASATPGTDPYAPGTWNAGNFYNGGSFLVGEATSPVVNATSFDFFEALPSWNATTPTGTWLEIQLQARIGTRWTKWYNMGIWASDYSTIRRHSVNLQGDTDGLVAVDTLNLTPTKGNAYQLKVRFFSTGSAVPTVRNASVALSNAYVNPTTTSPGNSANWNTLLAVPECSQMVYPDGGNVWCSPTSTAMVLKYWANDNGPCAPVVQATVDGVFDWKYDGHGNWIFNTAYAGSQGYEAYTARFSSLTQVEAWVKAGVPVVFSYAWRKRELTGAAVASSDGHLSVIVGFDSAGNPIVNDPAAGSDPAVQRTYLRSELERLWIWNGTGTVYLIYPSGHPVPNL